MTTVHSRSDNEAAERDLLARSGGGLGGCDGSTPQLNDAEME
jgi:hypothetical protein